MSLDKLLSAYYAAEPERQKAALDAALAALTGRAATGLTELTNREPIDRVLSAEEVAALANLSTRSLRSYARKGLIRRACFGAGKRCWGYTESSVREFLRRAAGGE